VYNTFLVKKNLYRLILNLEKNPIYEKLLCLKNKKDNVVLDIAAKGYYTSLFSRLVGQKSAVHSFYPILESYQNLIK
jgi:predicted methyltransferase